jgi:hypothetical protein
MFIKILENGMPSGNPIQHSGDIPEGYVQFILEPRPDDPDHLHEYQETTPTEHNGVWLQTWEIVERTFDTEEERAEAQEAYIKFKWEEIRAIRDYELGRTDWYALPDAPEMPPEVVAYRQALRDITDTYDNPEDVVWPEHPLNYG